MDINNETLNISHHIKQMLIKALNIYRDVPKAAAKLGVHPRTLYRYKKSFNIIKDSTGQFHEYKKIKS